MPIPDLIEYSLERGRLKYPSLYLCSDLYDILLKEPYIYSGELWEITHKEITPTLFFQYLGIPYNKKIFIAFKNIIKTFLLKHFSYQVDDTLLDSPEAYKLFSNSFFDRHVYSITYYWMLFFAKVIKAFEEYDDVHTYEREQKLDKDKWYELCRKNKVLIEKLQGFGLLIDKQTTSDYPNYPSMEVHRLN